MTFVQNSLNIFTILKEADITIYPLAVDYRKSKVIDFTTSVDYTSFAVVYPKPIIGPNFKGPVQPFSMGVRIYVVACNN